ncbi:hypothetical protein M130_2483 [Bacteroides fragilis str. S6R6]|nr:hypothetical protein M130_2483 [Bacteroides fragilis str. S6R6]EYB04720.1 hypothetical protein M129_2534 [Bacteroides fragilis str. S6R5]EYE53789.1 hypothetical protein M148_2526 [Bacteroides fragilis str. 1007-1-F \
MFFISFVIVMVVMIAIFGNKKQKSKKIDVYFLAFLHGDDSCHGIP